MSRPPIAPGSYGAIATKRIASGVFESSARYRRHDGSMARAWARGPSRTASVSALKARIRERLGDDFMGESLTVAQLADQWLVSKRAQRPALAPRTLESYEQAIATHVLPRLGALPVRECTAPRVERAILQLMSSQAPSTAARFRSVLRSMFGMAVRLGAVQVNPVDHTSRYRAERVDPRALTLEELAQLRDAVGAQQPPRTNRRKGATTSDVLEFIIGTGCRPGEALGLHWEDVHLDGERPWVRIHRQVVRLKGAGLVLTPTKTRDVRILALPEFAADALRALPQRTGPVFPAAGGGLRDPRAMRRIIHTALKGTEWEWVTAKVLRKTVATVVADLAGVDLAARQLGHRDERVTKAYYIAPSTIPLALDAMESLGGVALSDSGPSLHP